MSKIILITGTSSGFGSLAAPLLAQQGHRVYATMRDIEGRHRDVAETMRQGPGGITVLPLELANNEDNVAAVKRVVDENGRIDVIINNAGRFHLGIGESFSDQDLLEIYNVDVLGPWRLIRAALPHMRAQKSGYILTVSSSLARFSCPFMTAYASGKHALEGLIQGLKYELKSFNIDFSFVEPGIYPTRVFDHSGRGSDTARNTAYGPASNMADQIKGQLDGLFASEHANNPMLVADAMAALVAMAPGTRPIRLAVDPNAAEFTNRLNAVHEQEYSKFLIASGMGGLL